MRIHSAIAALLAACNICAAPIASDASGWYATPDRLCRVVLAKLGASINVDLSCIQDGTGQPTFSHTTADAFGHSCIGDNGVASVFAFHGLDPVGSGHVAFDQYGSGMLSVRIAPDPLQLYQGGGGVQHWQRVRAIASPAPFTCDGQPPGIDPRSRDLVCRINPNAPSCPR